LSDVNAPLGGPGIDPLSLLGPQSWASGQFDFYFTLSQVPPADEDKADLGVSKTCSWEERSRWPGNLSPARSS
jgi:hypothetical protein